MEKGWHKQVDTVITIMDVICLPFINVNVCCALFVLLDVKIKYANSDTKWMFLKWIVVRHCHSLCLLWATKAFSQDKITELNFKQLIAKSWETIFISSRNHKLIDWLINCFLYPSLFPFLLLCQRTWANWEDKMDKIYYPERISQAILTISWVITGKVRMIHQ